MTEPTQMKRTLTLLMLMAAAPQFVQRGFFENTPVPVAQANWIVSLVEARVERVVKDSPALAPDAGTPLVFEENNGVATIGQTRIETVVPWVRPIVVGRRYLLAGTVRDGRFIKGATYEEGDNGLLRSMRTPVEHRPGTDAFAVRDEPDEFEEWSIEEVVARLQAELNR